MHPNHTDLFFGTQTTACGPRRTRGRPGSTPPSGRLRPANETQDAGARRRGHYGGRYWVGHFNSSDHFATFDRWNDPPDNAGNPFIIDTGTYIEYTRADSAATGISLTTDTGTTWKPVRVPNGATAFTIQRTPSHFPQVVGPPNKPVIYQAVQKPGMTAGGPTIGLLRIDLDVVNRTATSTPADVNGLATPRRLRPRPGVVRHRGPSGGGPARPAHLDPARRGHGRDESHPRQRQQLVADARA